MSDDPSLPDGPTAAVNPVNRETSQFSVKLLSTVLTIALLIGLLVYALLFCRFAARLFTYPFDWEESDGNVILAGKLLEQGKPLYADPNEYPMLLYTYPPLYAFVVFAATRLFGDYVGIARLVSCALTAVIVLMIYHVVRREGALIASSDPEPRTDVSPRASRIVALMAALMMFPYGAGMNWMVSGRADAFFTMLLVAGFYGLSRGGGRTRSAAWLVLGWVAFLAAIYTKQAGLPAAAVVCAFLCVTNWRRGLCFSLSLAVAAGGVWLALQKWSHGWFQTDVFQFAADIVHKWPIEGPRLARYVAQLLQACNATLAVALATSFYALMRRTHLAWVVFFAGGLLWCVQTGHNSAGSNHMIPGVVAGCILFGIGAHRWLAWAARDGGPAAGWAHVAFLVVFVAQLVAPIPQTVHYQGPDESDLDAMTVVCGRAHEAQGPVLIDYMPSVARALDKWEYATDSCALWLSGAADPTRLITDFRNRRFAMVIVWADVLFRRRRRGRNETNVRGC